MIVVFALFSGAKLAALEAREDMVNDFSKCGVAGRVQCLFLTVSNIMVVQEAAGETRALRCLDVVQQPNVLQLRVASSGRTCSFLRLLEVFWSCFWIESG